MSKINLKIEDKTNNIEVNILQGGEFSREINLTFESDKNEINKGDEVLFNWSSENANEVLLDNIKVEKTGSKSLLIDETKEITLTAFNAEFVETKTIKINVYDSNIKLDERLLFASRIFEDSGEIIGFDLLKNNINAPVGRKAGKLYSNSGDDYSVIRNNEAYELNIRNVYEKKGVDVPRFDWTNGKQQLLVENQSTNLIKNNNGIGLNNYVKNTEGYVIHNTNIIEGGVDSISFRTASPLSRFEFNFASNEFNSNDYYVFSWYRKRLSYPKDSSHKGDLQIFGIQNIQMDTLDIKQTVSNIDDYDRFEFKFKIIDLNQTSTLKFLIGSINGRDNVNRIAYTMFQIEEGEQATSPILTNGTIKTRTADIIERNNQQLNKGRYETI